MSDGHCAARCMGFLHRVHTPRLLHPQAYARSAPFAPAPDAVRFIQRILQCRTSATPRSTHPTKGRFREAVMTAWGTTQTGGKWTRTGRLRI